MKLSQFISNFELHDAVIDEIQYDQSKQICTLWLSFHNPSAVDDNQSPQEWDWYYLTITGVTYVLGMPDLYLFLRKDPIDGEILDTSVTDLSNALEEWKLILSVSNYVAKTRTIHTILLSGSNVEWESKN